ncbi:hypothetical protein BDF14DRAFT_440021 [Spinellus fusiger]|nr:hypothetical protein BDF14DRAFT_440021 [Spinellus fusiger]
MQQNNLYGVYIERASVRNMLGFMCAAPHPRKSLLSVVSSDTSHTNPLYCTVCRCIASSVITYYVLHLTILDPTHNTLEDYVAYDKTVEDVMGCSAETLLEHHTINTLILPLHIHHALHFFIKNKGVF